jgi:hypothetical protein
MIRHFRRFRCVAVCIAVFGLAARADDAPPEPTPDTAKGAVKLMCHRLAGGDLDGAIALCPADTSDDDKALMKAAVECYKAYDDLRKAAGDKFGADAVAEDKYGLSGPRPPTDQYIDHAKESPSSDDPNKVELRMTSTMPPVSAVRQGDAWRVPPAELLRASSWNRGDPAECFHTFADYARQAARDVADGKFDSAKELAREMSRRRSDYSRAQSEKRRKGGL